MTQTPAIRPLNREKLSDSCNVPPVKEGFALKNSGTVIRSVSGTAPLHSRVWSPLKPVEGSQNEQSLTPVMRKNIILAEVCSRKSQILFLTLSLEIFLKLLFLHDLLSAIFIN